MFYWDPINGSDTNDGLDKFTAKLTWEGVLGELVKMDESLRFGEAEDIGVDFDFLKELKNL